METLEARCMLAAAGPVPALAGLYAGIGNSYVSPTNNGLLMVADVDSGAVAPLQNPLAAIVEGFSGLAFTSAGTLYGSTSAGPGSASDLVQLDRTTGKILSRVTVKANSLGISIGDLAVRPGPGPKADQLYAIRSRDDGRFGEGELYTIDPVTGVASLVGSTGAQFVGGLAFADYSTLYLAAVAPSTALTLNTIDPDAGHILSGIPLSDPGWGTVEGLAVRPSDGVVYGTDYPSGKMFRLNVGTGVRTPVTLDAPLRGVAGDIAFDPAPKQLSILYHEDFEEDDGGYIPDNTGGAIPGLWHYSTGRSADQLINHTPDHSWYYGALETPTGGGYYSAIAQHQGVLTSPMIPTTPELTLPKSGTIWLSFSYLLGTQLPLDRDFVEVLVDGASTPILARADGSLRQTFGRWFTATADLSQFAGQRIQLKFSFNTGPGIDPEGWYVDDVVIASIPAEPNVIGYKWHDRDGDKTWDQDAGEAGLAGWTIYARPVNTSPGDPAEVSTQTAADGRYEFHLPDGTYTIREGLQSGWRQSYPQDPDEHNPADHTITIVAGQVIEGRSEFSEPPNFGNYQPATISGYKWEDLDADGTWDPGEPGLPGWTVHLDITDTNTITTTTDAAGHYSFGGLDPGTYVVWEDLPDPWQQSYPGRPTMVHVITVTSGQIVAGQFEHTEPPNFGNWKPGEIHGYKWEDLDRDGVWDVPGEKGLNGWTIYLDANDNGQPDPGEPSTVTANDGEHDGAYAFLNLKPGTYIVHEVHPVDEPPTYPPDGKHEIIITSGQIVRGGYGIAEPPNFGNPGIIPPMIIRGSKWEDLDADGTWDRDDPNESGLAGWEIRAYRDENHNHRLDQDEYDLGPAQVDTTDVDGQYQFDVEAGDYIVVEVLPDPWKPSWPDVPVLAPGLNTGAITLGNFGYLESESSGPVAAGRDFGNFRPVTVSGVKFEDRDRNGQQDPGEPNLPNWTIQAYRDANKDQKLDQPEFEQGATTAVTDADGKYQLTLDPGNYIIVEVLADSSTQTFPLTSVLTPGLNTGTLKLGPFGYAETLQSGDDDVEKNFGNGPSEVVETGTIRGYKWHDANGDGDWDSNETGLNGWTIYLDKNNNGQPDFGEPATVTANDGEHDGGYIFTGLSAGTYSVREVLRDGWQQTYPSPPGSGHEVTIPPDSQGEYGEKAPPNFGNFPDHEWGDAPDSSIDLKYKYRTRVVDNGARHRVIAGFMLGDGIDLEPDGQPDPAALGDDNDNEGDEDGVEFVSAFVPGQPADIKVHLRRPITIETSFLDAWIDFDADGDWDELDDHIAASYPLGPGENTITIVVPQDAAKTATFARFRLSSRGGLSFDGRADDGEVEDYRIYVGILDTNVVQFITPMSVYRTEGPFARPPDSRIAVSGFVWHDQNKNEVWDTGEAGLDGVLIYADLDNDNIRDVGDPTFRTLDDGARHGAFWFVEDQFAASVPLTFTLRVELPTNLQPTFPGTPDFEHQLTIDPPNGLRSQGAFEKTEPPNFGVPVDFVTTPPTGKGSIKGYKWHDLDQDGIWDTDEPGRPGWRVYIDTNGDNAFDQEQEPFAITGADGSYVFTNVDAGTHTIREDTIGLSDGTFTVQPFPASDPSRDPDEHFVTLSAGQVIKAEPSTAMVPNFGGFEYSPFIRPADNHFGHIDQNGNETIDSTETNDLLLALKPWQGFSLTNRTGDPFKIVDIAKNIDTSAIAPANEFVRILLRTGDAWAEPSFPIDVPVGATLEFLAFYDPAIRVGGTVIQQFPDWCDDPSTVGVDESKTRPAHTFAQGDHLAVLTDAGATFRVDLVGGSTYDSDIFYDGVVDLADLRRLDDILLKRAVPGDPGWDPTSDINVRYSNGAAGMPEIGLGDFGPLNVEYGRARPPFLDLDADNSSEARGVDYGEESAGTAVPVGDLDARLANGKGLALAELEITVESPVTGDNLSVNPTFLKNVPSGKVIVSLPANGVPGQTDTQIVVTGNATPVLTLSNDPSLPGQAGFVETYNQVLKEISFAPSTSDVPPNGRTVEIRLVPSGNEGFVLRDVDDMDGDGNTNEVLIDHRNGNTAIARVVVRPSIPATSGPTSDTLLAVLALQAPANDDSSEERDSVFAELGSSQPAELDFFRPT